jgi:hypothetical protein
MSATVLLKDIVDALEMQSDDRLSFVDLDTGEVESVTRDLLSAAEEAEDEGAGLDVPGWQQSEWELAKRISSRTASLNFPTSSMFTGLHSAARRWLRSAAIGAKRIRLHGGKRRPVTGRERAETPKSLSRFA